METFKKRQKELKRLEKQRDKAARRMQRKQDRENGTADPSVDEDGIALPEDSSEAGPTTAEMPS